MNHGFPLKLIKNLFKNVNLLFLVAIICCTYHYTSLKMSFLTFNSNSMLIEEGYNKYKILVDFHDNRVQNAV